MIGNYSAFSVVDGKKEYFTGEDDKGKFKLVCPKCKAKGENLEHLNWYISKETGIDLIIACRICGNVGNVDRDELKDWKVRK